MKFTLRRLMEAGLKNTVLIADENRTLVMYLGILLKRMGFETVSARDGYEAMRLVEVCRPDIMMADASLPQFDALLALREFGSGTDGYRPSVIMLVGVADEKTEGRRRMLGTCLQLTKPVNASALHDAIQDCMFKPLGTNRKHMRTRIEIRLNVNGPAGARDLVTRSLSAGGAFIVDPDPPPAGESVDIFLPCSDDLCLFLTGRVIYTRTGGAGTLAGGSETGFAVEFLDMSPYDRSALDEFVRGKLTEGIGRDEIAPVSKADVYGALRSYASPSGE